jgi:putative redox protein
MKTVVRSNTALGKFAQDISTANHKLIGDEPVASGGNDAGPSPYDFLLTALGTCTSMTVKMYADFKKLPLEQVIVTLNYDKIHSKDCENCDNDTALLDHIDRKIELIGNLTDEQREKLLAIANKCPVHRTLTSKIIITTELIKSEENNNA